MSELPSATRNYVVLGVLLVAALALAIREGVRGSIERDNPSQWTHVLLVYDGEPPNFPNRYMGGFDIIQTELDEVTAAGRELLDDPDASPLAAAIAYADEQRDGFLLLDLRDGWNLSSFGVEPPPGSIVAAISIGDVAREGPRISFGAPVTGPFKYVDTDPRGGDLLDVTAIQLALFEHPDLQALFQFDIHGELATHSRWQLDEAMRLRAPLQSQQRSLADVDALWPSEPLTGNLAGRWEHVRAVPVLGGVVIEVLPIWLNVGNSVVSAELCGAEIGELKFVPNEALAAGADLVAARRPCTGLRPRDPGTKRYEANLGTSPDGRLLAADPGNFGDDVDIYRLILEDSVCQLQWVNKDDPPLGKLPTPSNAGKFGLDLRSFLPRSEPMWLSDDLLVELAQPKYHPPRDFVSVIDTSNESAPLAELDATTLFPKLDEYDPAVDLLDVHAAGPDTVFVLTEACPSSHGLGDARLQRPCMHRVRFRSSMLERLGRGSSSEPVSLSRDDIVVRTLGPIDSYRSLAISSDGTRAAYAAVDPNTLDSKLGLFSVVIEETGLGPIERIAANIHPDSRVRISPDGRVVVAESLVSLGKYGSRPTARAFLLAPSQPTP